jgi:hypothetical protein
VAELGRVARRQNPTMFTSRQNCDGCVTMLSAASFKLEPQHIKIKKFPSLRTIYASYTLLTINYNLLACVLR